MTDTPLPYGWITFESFGIWKNEQNNQEIIATDGGYKLADNPVFVDDPTIHPTLQAALTASERRWHRVNPDDYEAGVFAVATLMAKIDGYDILTLRSFGDYEPPNEYTPNVDQYVKEAGYITDGFDQAISCDGLDPYTALDAWLIARFKHNPQEFIISPQTLKDRAKILLGDDYAAFKGEE